MNTYLTVSSFLNLLAALLQVAFILSSRDRNPVRKRYLYFLLAITVWSFAYTLWRLSTSEVYAVYYCNVLISAAAFQPVALYHFSLELAGEKTKRLVYFGYAAAFLLVCAVPFGLIVDGVSPRHGHDFWPNAGALMPVYLLVFSGYLFAALWVLFKGWSRNLGGKASDYLLVLFSALIGFTGGATNFPLWYDIPLQPYGNILVSVYLFLMVHGLYHNRIFGFSLDLYKAIVGLMLNVSVALFYLLFFVLFRSLSGDPVSVQDFWLRGFIAFGCSALVFWGVPKFRYWTESILEGVFRKDRVSALAELKELPMKLADLVDEQSMFEAVGDTLMRSIDVSGVAVYRLEVFESNYSCKYSSGKFNQAPEEYLIEPDNPIIDGLSRKPEALIFAQVYGELSEQYYSALVSLRNDMSLSVVVPIFADHEVFGLILLGALSEARPFTEDESAILFSIGAQIGLNLRIRDLERRSNEVDKLVALGTMAAGLAHEIRNPLVSVQTLATLVQAGKSVESVSDDFKDVLLRDVKRIGNIVEGVALYSQNQQSRRSPANLLSIIRSSMEIYESSAKIAGVEIRFNSEIDESVVILASMDQLMQVFNNLIENALHALSGIPSPCITIEVGLKSMRSRERKSWVDVSVSDNGKGIPPAILPRIFDPFITSKDTGTRLEKHGMGLGLAISKRIVDNHNGAITVSNMPDGGANFVVSLKVFDSKEKDA
ncbi:MAG: ATP-binding protein [Opitutaceae bacterium]